MPSSPRLRNSPPRSHFPQKLRAVTSSARIWWNASRRGQRRAANPLSSGHASRNAAPWTRAVWSRRGHCHRGALLGILTLLITALTAGAASRPNILWLIAEDLGPELQCYGTTQVWTPNIDRLAIQGVRYTRAYTTAPVCSASRSAFMTGMYQTTIGAQNHRSHRDDGYELPDGVRVLTDWMRDAGYYTANLRKLPAACGFRGTGKTDWNFTYHGKPFDSDNWTDLKAHQPFYAQLNFSETHRAFHAPKKADPDKVVIPPYYPDHPVTREDWAAYLDSATELDRKIGRVLEQLEADGLAENTIVIFFGDHGQAQVRGKQFCYEEGLHIPLIIRWPKDFPPPAQIKPGHVDDRLIEAIDFAPTMLDIAGARVPAKMQGQIFLGEHAAPPRTYAFGARDRCDETVFRLRTVRDDRYRYIRNFTPDRPFLSHNAYKERQIPGLEPSQKAACGGQAHAGPGVSLPAHHAAGGALRSAKRPLRNPQPGELRQPA